MDDGGSVLRYYAGRHPTDSQIDQQWNYHDVVELTKNRNEIRNEVKGHCQVADRTTQQPT